MNSLIDGADRVFWWLRKHPPVTGGIGVVVVAVVAALLLLGGDDKGGGGKVPDSAIATVGGTPITNASLAHWQTVYTASNTGTAKPTVAQARQAAFELLAGSAWIVKEAERQKVVVSDADAKKATDTYLTQAATSTKLTKAALLKQMGTTEADVQFQQRVSLLAAKLQQKIVAGLPAPSSADISKAYADDAERWATPSQRDVEAVITASQADAAAAKKELEGGATFAAVNQKYSSNSTLSGSAGVLKGLKPGSTEPAVERPIFSAPQGSLQGPVKAGNGYMVFKVSKVTPLPKQTLAQATTAIKTDLTTAAQNAATNGFLAQLRKRWKPQTACRATVKSSEYCGTSA
jgi:parvulin-like peptidyl-prolyl isomerase